MGETLVKTEEFKDSPLEKIPEDWEVVKLESLLSGRPKNGYSPKEVNEWTGTLMLGLGCLTEEGFEPCQLKNAPSNDLKIRAALLSDGDFLLSRSNTRERVALAGIYRDVGVPCIYSDLMMRLSLNEKICSRFMELLLRHSPVRRQLTGNAQGTSGSMVKISSQTVMETVVLLPPRKEQDRIISVMDTLDQAIAHTSSLIAKLKQMKAGLLHDLLTRGLDENGELRDAIGHPEQFKDSPLGRIPQDWDTSILDKIISIIDCKHYTPKYVSDGIPIVRPRNIKVDGLDFSDIDYVLEKEYELLTDKHLPRQGDIVFSRNASFGIPCYVDTTQRFAIGQDVVIMTELSANTRFVYYTLISDSTEKQIQNVSAGSTFGRINLACIRELVVPVPPREEQERIAQILDTYDTRIRTEEAYREKLKLQKQGLMHDLLAGKVRVKI